MNHPTDDALLLHAYGETPDAGGPELDGHLRTCPECRGTFAMLEEARVAIDMGLGRRARRVPRLAWLALPMAAVVAGLLLVHRTPSRPAETPAWQSHLLASPNAGYVAGGPTFNAIDSMLTRLERGVSYERRTR